MMFLTPILLLFKNSKSWKNLLTPGFISSSFLSLLFIVMRKLKPICNYLPSENRNGCMLDWRELELFTFFLTIMLLKNRQSVSVQQTITNVLMYSKLVNIVLFYRLSPMAGFAYAAACFIRLWMFPENFVDGPEEITYFSDKTLEEVLKEDNRVTWVVEFYATWSPPCRAMMPAFAALSNQYANEFLRFGKVDVGKYPEAAKTHGVSVSSMTRQLPTVMVFEEGKAADWRPMIGDNKRLVKYCFTEENMIRDFGLNKLCDEAKRKCKKYKKSKKSD